MTTIQVMKPSDITLVAKMAQELFKENDFAALKKNSSACREVKKTLY